MSKAFTKEDDGEEAMLVPPRAPLPTGVPNYVTARGMALLRGEWAHLEEERAQLVSGAGESASTAGTAATAGTGGGDHSRRLAFLQGRIGELAARIGSAQIIAVPAKAPTEVRFGTTVTLRALATGDVKRFTVVGVDEADGATGLVAFVSPIARVMLGHAAGETVALRAGRDRDRDRIRNEDEGQDEQWVIQTVEQTVENE